MAFFYVFPALLESCLLLFSEPILSAIDFPLPVIELLHYIPQMAILHNV